MALSPEDEQIASQYRKMINMGLPEGAVIQKMTMGGVPEHIQNSVLGGEDNSPTVDDVSSDADAASTEADRRSSLNKSAASFWEEVIEDESIEEEVVDDDDDDDDSEEYEEEVVDESDDNNQKEEEANSEKGSQKEESESDSEGAVSTGVVPEARAIAATETSNTPIYDTSGGDVENQEQVREYEAPYQPQAYQPESHQPEADQPEAYPHPPNMAPMSTTPEKPLPSPKSSWYWIVCLVLFLLVGAGAGGGYWLTTLDGDDVTILNSLPRTSPPTEAPSASVSTEFDAVQGKCNFNGVQNPNPIDQCDCFGKITDLETDVRDRYLYNREIFIPKYIADYNDEISSCSPRNQALVWISSGKDTQITTEERAQKFALATVFASLGGSQWNNNTNWLANGDICSWHDVQCSEGRVTQLILDRNNLVGTVSFI